jgi:hypothetical protein
VVSYRVTWTANEEARMGALIAGPMTRTEEPVVARKAAAFAAYLQEIGLPLERVLGDLGPAEVEDVISFFYAGMPDRFKGAHRGRPGPDDLGGAPVPTELWCAAVWEADEAPNQLA